MTTFAIPDGRRGAALRVVEDELPGRAYGMEAEAEQPQVLLAGADAGWRSDLLATLRQALPELRVVDCGDVWHVVREAARSTAVVVNGDLADAPGPSLARLLRHRHPEMPLLLRAGELDPGVRAGLAECGCAVFRAGAGDASLASALGRAVRDGRGPLRIRSQVCSDAPRPAAGGARAGS